MAVEEEPERAITPHSYLQIQVSPAAHSFQKIRLANLLEDEARRKQLLQTTGEEAQKWLDLLQALSEFPGTPSHSRSLISKLILRLSKRTGLWPQCLMVKKPGDYPVDWGGFGDVWKGKIGEQVVCLKVVKIYLTSDVQQVVTGQDLHARSNCLATAQTSESSTFMGIYYLGEAREQLYLVSPWMEHGNLGLISERKAQTSCEASFFGKRETVPSGLFHLHDTKIVHGDLKGINILVTPGEQACIEDFGLARIANSHVLGFSSSMSGTIKGTIRWQAPELLSSDPPAVVSTQSGIYAFGCVCYEIFTGHVPFYELMDGAVVVAVLMQKKTPSTSY
ncbi:kinase-like protein [Marasmius fiardii PR-910]|nr:kinase-like protein [Marasmius fiardii PR-910]